MRNLNAFTWSAGYLLAYVIMFPICIKIIKTFERDGAELYITIPLYIALAAFGVILVITIACDFLDDVQISSFLNGKSVEVGRTPFMGLTSNIFTRLVSPIAYAAGPFIGLAEEAGWGVLIIVLPLIYPLLVILILFIPFMLIMLVFFAIVDVIYLLVMAVVKIIDGSQYSKNTTRYVCPKCSACSDRPTYSLGMRDVQNVRPSRYGIFTTEVEGNIYKCTNIIGKRKDYDQKCPKCNVSVNIHESRPLVISLAGASSAGKTYFKQAVFTKMIANNCNGIADTVHIEPAEAMNENSKYVSNSRIFTKDDGYVAPDCLRIESKKYKTERILFMFDINGNYFTENGSKSDLQIQYPYGDGIAFILDPNVNEPEREASEYYTGFMIKYREMCQMKVSKKIQVPIAIIVNKSDMGAMPKSMRSSEVRERLMNLGFGSFITRVEQDFANVSYFSCTSMNADYSVLDPMEWLSNKSGSDFGKLFK